MSRIPSPTPEQLTREQATLYAAITGGPRAQGPQHFALTADDGSLLGPFNAFLLSPVLGGALQELGSAVRYATALTPRMRELAILIVAAHWRSAFERHAHEAVGRAAGLSDEEFAAIRDGRALELNDVSERATIELCRALVAGDVVDTLWASVREVLDERTVFELTTLVGYYATLALQLRVFRVDGSDPDPEGESPRMKLTHYGHACVLVETGGARILIDPGTLSSGFEPVRELDAVLITHDHPDHLDVDRLGALLAANPGAALYSDAGTAPALAAFGVAVAEAGATLAVGGSTVSVFGGSHAAIYEDIPGSGNVAYDIDAGAFFHPGDSFQVPPHPVDVLGLPICAPWLKLAEAIDYLRAVAPRVAVPIHQADLVDTGTSYFMVGHFTPDGTTFQPIEQRTPTEF